MRVAARWRGSPYGLRGRPAPPATPHWLQHRPLTKEVLDPNHPGAMIKFAELDARNSIFDQGVRRRRGRQFGCDIGVAPGRGRVPYVRLFAQV
jgi:hypothetical protein